MASKDNLRTISASLESSLEQLRSELDDLRRDKLDKIEPDVKKSENFISKINQLHAQIDLIKQDLNEQVREPNKILNLFKLLIFIFIWRKISSKMSLK